MSVIPLAIGAEHPQALVLSADLLQAATAPFLLLFSMTGTDTTI